MARPHSNIVTPQYLLEGALYALEQCGILLHDAITLYHDGAYPSAIVLAAFAREELGRFRILLDLRKEVLGGQRKLTTKDIQKECEDHVRKQEWGQLSTTIISLNDSATSPTRPLWTCTAQSRLMRCKKSPNRSWVSNPLLTRLSVESQLL